MTIWYNVGTATATNGSTAVTGALTAWLANVKPGDEFYFTADARGYEVASVESNTALTLATAYQGSTGSGKAYATKQIGPGWHLVTELSVSVADLLTLVGNEITNGVGVPSNDEGNDGDTYIRTDVPSIYAKEGGAWVLKATLSGPPGDPGPSYQATSTSSVAIGTGSKSFTLVETGRGYTVGQRLRVTSSASTSNYMEGLVTSYSSPTLVINVDKVGGSGTIASWNINVTGDVGPANSLAIGSVTASNPGANAEATITGAAPSQTLNLVLPRGATGPANSLSIGTVEQGSAAASITGDAPAQTLNLTIPKGDAATITVGDVTTVDPGDPATVTNSGTSAAAVFDFEIPQGEPGVSVNHLGDYDNGTEYSFNDEVLDNGSTWRYINETPASGNAPPTLPTTSNAYWQLSAQRGVDGGGAVNTVNSQSPDITGNVVLSGSDIEANHTAVNYVTAGSSIGDHFAGLDSSNAPGAALASDLASASTCDLGGTTTLRVRITGTTTITSLGSVASKWRLVDFAGALTLTHNGTSLILPGSANIVTAAGDAALFSSDVAGNWRCFAYQRANQVPNRLPTKQIFTSSSTWNRPVGCRFIKVTAVGPGGGGAGAAGAGSSASRSGGGGAGAVSIKWIDVTSISSETVTVGAAGTAGTAGANNGGNGGTSSFGAHCSAGGGLGGSGLSAGTSMTGAPGGAGGTATGGDLNITGAPGGLSIRLSGTITFSGNGASNAFGGGGPASPANSAGSAGGLYGGGGGGGHSADGNNYAGGAGGNGVVIVEEFY